MEEQPFMEYVTMPPLYGYNVKEFNEALELIKDAVSDERRDELFYDYLISEAPTQEEKDIITDIKNDEMQHNKYFREIYRSFTGVELPYNPDVEFEEPDSYLDGIRTALFGELAAVEKYRTIRKAMPNRYYRDILFEIITDELKHSGKYNYIYTKNLTK